MFKFPSRIETEYLRKAYPCGTRIRLIHMNDSCHPVEDGMTGTVTYVDDAGNIHMNWDNGRTLALVPGDDVFEKIKE